MKPHFFPAQSDFRKRLKKNHKKEKELLVGFYKVGSGKPSMTWSESVDQALCFGWIDGVRKSFDDKSYTIRFTPRRQNSIWSKINIAKVKELTKKGLMQPAGLESFKHLKEHRTNIYSFEKAPSKFEPAYEKKLKANKAVWKYFTTQAPWYQKVMTHWVMSAKQEETRLRRLEKLINESSKEKRVLL